MTANAALNWMFCAQQLAHNTPASSARGPLWVHWQGGYRATIAASLLHPAGRAVTAAGDDFSCAAAEGLVLTGEPGYSPAGAPAASAGRTGRVS